MKRIILTVISLLAIVITLGGCSGAGGQQLAGVETDNAPDPETVKASDYSNDLEGLEKYLNALGYIPSDTKPNKMMYSVIGAKNGDRYNFNVNNSAVYVEIYEYDPKDLNDEAKRVISEVKKDGKYYVFGKNGANGDASYEASLSSNGKYLVSYTLNTDDEKCVKRKEAFINAVKEYYR